MKLRTFVIMIGVSLMLAVPLGAQQPPAQVDGFQKMSSLAPREVLPATPLVFYAYSFVWLALLAYVFSIWRRMSRVEQELADVQRRLKNGRAG
jgi:CcmD family protein